jgi:hypothetical protein
MNEIVRIDPAETVALVVGIGSYLGEQWKIPNAAADALAFAYWLIRKVGVPADRVLVLVTPKHKSFKKLPVRWGAAAEEIRALATGEIATICRSVEAKLLLIYWAGHGFVDDETEGRNLLMADAHSNDLRYIDLNDLRRAFKTDGYPARQIYIIDACASILPRHSSAAEVSLPRGPLNPHCAQFLLFSTKPGQPSPELTRAHRHSFNRVLLDTLESISRYDSWPPDIVGVTERVQAIFRRFCQEGGCELVPQYENKGWDVGVPRLATSRYLPVGVDAHRAAILADGLSRLRFFDDPSHRANFLDELSKPLASGLEVGDKTAFCDQLARNLLAPRARHGPFLETLARFGAIGDESEVFQSLDSSFRRPFRWWQVAQLGRLLVEPSTSGLINTEDFRAIAIPILQRATLPGTDAAAPGRPVDVVVSLAASSRVRPEPPLLRLVAELAEIAASPLRESLKKWLEKTSRSFGIPAPQPQSNGAQGPVSLAVVVEPHPEQAGRFDVMAWRSVGDDRSRLDDGGGPRQSDDLPELIDGWLRGCPGQPSIELVLPLELLAKGAARWMVEVVPYWQRALDALYPILLRSWDRHCGRDAAFTEPEVMEAWHGRWANRPERDQKLGPEHWIDLHASERDNPTEILERHRKGGPVCVAPSIEPSSPHRRGKESEDILKSLLLAGTPVAVWPSAAPGAEREPDGEEWIGVVRGSSLESLPARIFECRSRTVAPLCLLYDDPDRPPPGSDFAFSQPTPVGT